MSLGMGSKVLHLSEFKTCRHVNGDSLVYMLHVVLLSECFSHESMINCIFNLGSKSRFGLEKQKPACHHWPALSPPRCRMPRATPSPFTWPSPQPSAHTPAVHQQPAVRRPSQSTPNTTDASGRGRERTMPAADRLHSRQMPTGQSQHKPHSQQAISQRTQSAQSERLPGRSAAKYPTAAHVIRRPAA